MKEWFLENIAKYFADENLIWTLMLLLSILIMAAGYVIYYFSKKSIITRNMAFICFILISAAILYPFYAEGLMSGEGGLSSVPSPAESFFFAFLHALHIVAIDGDMKEVFNVFGRIPLAMEWYPPIVVALYVVGPMLTVAVILSFIKNIAAHIRYRIHFCCEKHIFSELNEKSIELATSILKKSRAWFLRPLIVFTDVLDPQSEDDYDLLDRAENMGAVCFRSDLQSIRFGGVFCKLKFYLISDNEDEKIRHIEHIIRKYDVLKWNPNELYVFSDKTESIMMNAVKENRYMKMIRVDDIQMLIYHTLDRNGLRLFETARRIHGEDKKGVIHINAVIIGFGRYGEEMFKALLWFCQMPGYEISVHIFDSDEKQKEYIECRYRVLLDQMNHRDSGDPRYSIDYSGVGTDVKTLGFAEKFNEISDPTYVFVAIGSDADNIEASKRVRAICEDGGKSPDIETVVYNSDMKEQFSTAWPLDWGLKAATGLITGVCCYTPEGAYKTMVETAKLTEEKIRAVKGKKNHGCVMIQYRVNVQELFAFNGRGKKLKTLYKRVYRYRAKYLKHIDERILSNKDRCDAQIEEQNGIVIAKIYIDAAAKINDSLIKSIKIAVKKARELCRHPVVGYAERGIPYNIHMIGDLQSLYSYDTIIDSQLQKRGRDVDNRWSIIIRENEKKERLILEEMQGRTPVDHKYCVEFTEKDGEMRCTFQTCAETSSSTKASRKPMIPKKGTRQVRR